MSHPIREAINNNNIRRLKMYQDAINKIDNVIVPFLVNKINNLDYFRYDFNYSFEIDSDSDFDDIIKLYDITNIHNPITNKIITIEKEHGIIINFDKNNKKISMMVTRN